MTFTNPAARAHAHRHRRAGAHCHSCPNRARHHEQPPSRKRCRQYCLDQPRSTRGSQVLAQGGAGAVVRQGCGLRRALSRTIPGGPRGRGTRRTSALAGHARRRAGAGDPAGPVSAQRLSRHARMYDTDALARKAANAALAAGYDQQIPRELRKFFVLPFAHSEDLADQERAVALARRIGPDDLAHAEHHRDIVRRFGRFPHRNQHPRPRDHGRGAAVSRRRGLCRMSTETAEAPDARSVLLRADVGVTPERVLALAWIRLAGQLAHRPQRPLSA